MTAAITEPVSRSADAVTDEQIAMVLRSGITGGIAAVFIATLYAVAIWPFVEHSWIVAWYAALVLVGVVRVVIGVERRRQGLTRPVGRSWRYACLMLGTLSGLFWGIATLVLFPFGHYEVYLVMACILIGMPAAAVTSHGAWFPSFVGYLAGSMGLFTATMLLSGDFHLVLSGIAGAVFSVFLLREGWTHSRTIRSQISQRVALESMANSLTEARDAAEAANRAKSSFLANMSHELRTPLTAVIGMSDLLAGEETNPQSRRFATIIRQSALSLLAIINDVLDLSRIEAGRLELRAVPFELQTLLREIREMFQPEADRKEVGLRIDVQPGVPSRLIADPVRVRQVLVNLLGNAFKFTHAGHIDLVIAVEQDAGDRVVLRFDVADTGIGIPESARNAMFRSFSQVHEYSDGRQTGTGLGLHICAQLVAMMGGQIDFDSEPGRGSRFWFTVPAALPAAVFAPPVEPAAAASPAANAPQARILVVDDNDVNLLIATTMLESLGCEVHGVGSGAEGLRQLEAGRYDLVFMDDQMPEMDGREATRRWREREQATGLRIPIVALTANAMPGDRERYLEAGMDDYVSKPFRVEDLRDIVSRHVANASS